MTLAVCRQIPLLSLKSACSHHVMLPVCSIMIMAGFCYSCWQIRWVWKISSSWWHYKLELKLFGNCLCFHALLCLDLTSNIKCLLSQNCQALALGGAYEFLILVFWSTVSVLSLTTSSMCRNFTCWPLFTYTWLSAGAISYFFAMTMMPSGTSSLPLAS